MVDEHEDVGKQAEPITGNEAVGAEVRAEALQAELAQEKEKAEKYLDNWRRAQADFMNYKRRAEQQRGEDAKFANAMTVMSVLPVLDDMGRALQTIPSALAGLTWFDGVRLIYRKLQMGLEACGVTEIKAEGEPFDPNLHEAVMYKEGEDGKVVAEFQKGYKLHDRVIRPAMVAVGNGTMPSPEEGKEQEGLGRQEE